MMPSIPPEEVLRLAVERASALNGLWNLFIAVATAVIGVLAAGKRFASSRSLKVCLTVAFVAFAGVNLDAMIHLGMLRSALLAMLPTDLAASLAPSLSPAAWWQYAAFHLLLDVIVVTAIWRVPWPTTESDVP